MQRNGILLAIAAAAIGGITVNASIGVPCTGSLAVPTDATGSPSPEPGSVPCAGKPMPEIEIDDAAPPAEPKTDYTVHVFGERPTGVVADPKDDPIRFDRNHQPVFTPSQRGAFDRDFQAGLMLYARTREGRAMIEKYGGEGRARIRITLEPRGLDDLGSTTSALGNAVSLQNGGPLAYAVTINSSLEGIDIKGAKPLGYRYPATTPTLRALQIGAEMLHVDFFVQGHPLGKHHDDPAFQTRWRALARELGCPGFPHHD